MQLTNLESGMPTNLAKAMRMVRQSAALALPVVSALRWAHSDSASNAIFPSAIARTLNSPFDSLPRMAPD